MFILFILYFDIVCLGLSAAILGPTLIALGSQIGVEHVGSLSFLFVLRAAMYLLGTIEKSNTRFFFFSIFTRNKQTHARTRTQEVQSVVS